MVLAFAQPYFPSEATNTENKEIAVFLDNSYSMSLKGENTRLFDQAREELLEALPSIETFHLSTHDDNFKNLNAEEFKSWLYDIDYTSKTLDLNALLTKTQSLFNKNTASVKEIVILSDFQKLKMQKKFSLILISITDLFNTKLKNRLILVLIRLIF